MFKEKIMKLYDLLLEFLELSKYSVKKRAFRYATLLPLIVIDSVWI